MLAISRRLAELQDQERLAHHEQELANLRSLAHSSLALHCVYLLSEVHEDVMLRLQERRREQQHSQHDDGEHAAPTRAAAAPRAPARRPPADHYT